MGTVVLFVLMLIVTVCNVLVGIAIGRKYEREYPQIAKLSEFTVCDWCKTPEEIAALFAERCGTAHNTGSMPRSEPRAAARLP